MWQRIARLGARFGRVPETLAYYLQREGSLSADPVSHFEAALSTIELGHGPDARISEGPHVSGEPPENLAGAKLNYLSWIAGTMIARGFDPAPLLSRIEPGFPHLQPDDAGESIYRAVPAALAARRSVWNDDWSRLEPAVARFLNALERHMAAPGHARSTMHAVTRRVLDARVSEAASVTLVSAGDVGAVTIDVSAAIADMRTELKRVRAHVHVKGDAVGVLELPVIDGLLRATVLRDAIADRFAWLLLQIFRSEERRVGNECCRQCRSRWSRDR